MTLRSRRSVGLLLVGAVACVLAALVVPGSAGAADVETVQVSLGGAAFTTHPSGVLLDVNSLAPGEQSSGTMALRSGMHSGARLSLLLVDVADDDNGCVGPEVAVDPSCGVGDGDLGTALRFTVAVAGSPTGAYVPRWSGTADQLRRAADTGTVVGVGATKWVRLTAALPGATSNIVQSDTFGFGVRVVLQDVGGGNGVAATAVHNAPGGSAVDAASGSRLGLTGVPVELLALATLLLVVAGLIGLRAGRRRRLPVGHERG